MTADLPSYTWQQVRAKCDEPDTFWVYCGDKVYDISDWMDKHPGGRPVLELAAGRDITDVMVSYHPFTEKPAKVLEKYLVGRLEGGAEFPRYKEDSGFYRDVRQAAKEYFERTGLDSKDPRPGLARLAVMLVVAFWALSVSWDANVNWYLRMLAAVLFGVCQALPLLHIMHDSSHCAVSHKPWMWKTWGMVTMDWFAGASLDSWYHQHVVGHHLFCNVHGADPDLPVEHTGDIRRVSELQRWEWFYRIQHIYLAVLYGVLAIKFRIQDLISLATGWNGPIRVNNRGLREWTWQFITKSFWFAWRIALPLGVLGVKSSEFWILFLIGDLVTGWYLAFNFQVSHVSPSAVFPDIKTDSGFDDEWAVSQVLTTVDYDHGNTLMTFLCGALNYQTVHHLFPCVSQYHYPALAPIIMDICKQYGIRYTHIDTFWEALGLHFAHLRDLGKRPTK